MSLRRCTTGLTSLPAVLCSNFKSASAACPIAQHFVFQPFHFLLPCFAFVSTAVRMLPLCGPKAFWKGQLERYPEVVNDGGFFVLFLSCLETLCGFSLACMRECSGRLLQIPWIFHCLHCFSVLKNPLMGAVEAVLF